MGCGFTKGVDSSASSTVAMLVCDKMDLFPAEVTKAIWVYIKKKGLNKGRIISPDATLKTIFPVKESACMGGRGAKERRNRKDCSPRFGSTAEICSRSLVGLEACSCGGVRDVGHGVLECWDAAHVCRLDMLKMAGYVSKHIK